MMRATHLLMSHPFAFAAITVLACYGIAWLMGRLGSRRQRTWTFLALSAVWIATAAALTLRPLPVAEPTRVLQFTPLLPLLHPRFGSDTALWLGNVMLFLPLGVILRAAGLKSWLVIRLAVAVSICIEGVQYAQGAGRQTDVNDLILNTLGAWLGIAIFDRARGGNSNRDRQTRSRTSQ